MSTTRSQKRKNTQREADDNVSEGFVSPINMENSCLLNQNVELADPSRPKSPRVEKSFLESIRSSLKEEITSEIRALLLESQKEMLKLLRSETKENARDEASEELGNETRNLYTPTKTVRINSTQNEDHSIIRNSLVKNKTTHIHILARTLNDCLARSYKIMDFSARQFARFLQDQLLPSKILAKSTGTLQERYKVTFSLKL